MTRPYDVDQKIKVYVIRCLNVRSMGMDPVEKQRYQVQALEDAITLLNGLRVDIQRGRPVPVPPLSGKGKNYTSKRAQRLSAEDKVVGRARKSGRPRHYGTMMPGVVDILKTKG